MNIFQDLNPRTERNANDVAEMRYDLMMAHDDAVRMQRRINELEATLSECAKQLSAMGAQGHAQAARTVLSKYLSQYA